MKKYIVGYKDSCHFVCSSLADAEEMILSLTEEAVYENWFCNNCHPRYSQESYETPVEYFKNRYDLDPLNWFYVLLICSNKYWIDEVQEV